MRGLQRKVDVTECFRKTVRQSAGKSSLVFTKTKVFTETIVLNIILMSEGQYLKQK